jgi:hypothetical protein
MSKASLMTTFSLAAAMMFGGNDLKAQGQNNNNDKNNGKAPTTSMFAPSDTTKVESVFIPGGVVDNQQQVDPSKPWANDAVYQAELKKIEATYTAAIGKVEVGFKQNDTKRGTADARYEGRETTSKVNANNGMRAGAVQILGGVLGGGDLLQKAQRVGNGVGRVATASGRKKVQDAQAEQQYDQAMSQLEISDLNLEKQRAQAEATYLKQVADLDKKFATQWEKENKLAAKGDPNDMDAEIQKLKDDKYKAYVKTEINANREPKDRAGWDQMLKDNAAKHEQKQQQTKPATGAKPPGGG